MGNYRKRWEINEILWLPVTSGLWCLSHTPHGPRKYRRSRAISNIKRKVQIGLNDVQVWNRPCTDKSSCLELGKGFFTVRRFERRESWAGTAGALRRNPGAAAPSSASPERRGGFTASFQIPCSLKPDPAEEWAYRSSQTRHFPTARWAKENSGSGCGARRCGKRNGTKCRALYKSERQKFWFWWHCIQLASGKGFLSLSLSDTRFFWSKAFLSFKDYFWK